MPAAGTEDLARYIIEPSKGALRGPGRDGSPPPIPKEIVFVNLGSLGTESSFLSVLSLVRCLETMTLACLLLFFFMVFSHFFFLWALNGFLHHVQPGASAAKNIERLQVAKLVFFQEAMRESRFAFAGLSLLDTFQSSMAFVHSQWWEAP